MANGLSDWASSASALVSESTSSGLAPKRSSTTPPGASTISFARCALMAACRLGHDGGVTVPRLRGNALSTLRAMRWDPLGTMQRVRGECGMIGRVPMPGMRLYLVSDPTAIHHALTATGRDYAKGL